MVTRRTQDATADRPKVVSTSMPMCRTSTDESLNSSGFVVAPLHAVTTLESGTVSTGTVPDQVTITSAWVESLTITPRNSP